MPPTSADSREGYGLRAIVRDVDPDMAPQAMAPMEDVLVNTIAQPRFHTRLLTTFSVIALVLAALGIYGVLAAAVAEQQREIGIRVALGAERSVVASFVLRRRLLLTAAGILLGLLGSLAANKAVSTLLYEVTPTDPLTFVTAVIVLILVAFSAALVPALRAARVDPLVAIRQEI